MGSIIGPEIGYHDWSSCDFPQILQILLSQYLEIFHLFLNQSFTVSFRSSYVTYISESMFKLIKNHVYLNIWTFS
jgi:hypothetical protein